MELAAPFVAVAVAGAGGRSLRTTPPEEGGWGGRGGGSGGGRGEVGPEASVEIPR